MNILLSDDYTDLADLKFYEATRTLEPFDHDAII